MAASPLTTTLDGRNVLREGWLTVYKSRNPTFFTKLKPDKVLERVWGVIHQHSPKGPLLTFYQDNRKETKVLKREKVEVLLVKMISKLVDHPRHAFCFTLKLKGKRNRLLFNCDTQHDLTQWVTVLTDLLQIDFKMERVMWEYLAESGLWQAMLADDSIQIEGNYSDQTNMFDLPDKGVTYHYNLNNMTRTAHGIKQSQRIKRTPFVWDKPDHVRQKMRDLPAIWEWGDPSKEEWHPFERETNIQIENMYDSGSQYAELTLCLPSPMLFLLNLQDMKLVNSSTAVRYCLRRNDNSANVIPTGDYIQPHPSPSPDLDDDDDNNSSNMISPTSPLFQSLQSCLEHLQIPRKTITYKELLGEGAFGDVYHGIVTELPGQQHEQPVSVAVKQLRLSDFIARHGHHSQQMEDFLREAKEMAKVDHCHVVTLLAVCTKDYPLLLIEEYMNQGDLLAVLKESRPHMELVQQLSFAWQTADGMDYLASTLNCVHRDLAARNVMVHRQESGEMLAKIADFGLSRHLYSEMYKHQGTKPRPLPAKWMALESLMYFIFTTKSDVWSFGVLLWETMTLGRTPYPGVENRELLEQIEEHGLRLSPPKPCPSVIYDIILDCTQHDPDDRPTFADLRDRLQEMYEDAKSGKLVATTENEAESTEAAADEASKQENAEEKTTQDENKAETTVGDKAATGEEEATSTEQNTAENENKKAEETNPDDTREEKEDKDGTSKTETDPDNPTAETRKEESSTTETVSSEASVKPEGVKLASAIKLEQIDVGIKERKPEEDQEVSEVGHLYYVIDNDGLSKPETVVESGGCGQESRDSEEGVVKDETAQPPPNGSVQTSS